MLVFLNFYFNPQKARNSACARADSQGYVLMKLYSPFNVNICNPFEAAFFLRDQLVDIWSPSCLIEIQDTLPWVQFNLSWPKHTAEWKCPVMGASMCFGFCGVSGLTPSKWGLQPRRVLACTCGICEWSLHSMFTVNISCCSYYYDHNVYTIIVYIYYSVEMFERTDTAICLYSKIVAGMHLKAPDFRETKERTWIPSPPVSLPPSQLLLLLISVTCLSMRNCFIKAALESPSEQLTR